MEDCTTMHYPAERKKNPAPLWAVYKEREKCLFHALFLCQRLVGEKNCMNKNYDYKNEIRTPSGIEYDHAVAISIRRRYGVAIQGDQLTTVTHYTIGGMRYKVNSVFDLSDAPNCEEGLKRLMINEANKAL